MYGIEWMHLLGRGDMEKRYWVGKVSTHDDFDVEIGDTFIDGRTMAGPWAIMTPSTWRMYGVGRFGTGYGQMYMKQDDGKWMKVEG
jgi:hypothetical protein